MPGAHVPQPPFPHRGNGHGLIDDLPFDLLDYPPAGTIFDMLTRHGISWANYHAVPRRQAHGPALRPITRRRMARRRLPRLGRALRQ